jgi:hypothetical protein
MFGGIGMTHAEQNVASAVPQARSGTPVRKIIRVHLSPSVVKDRIGPANLHDAHNHLHDEWLLPHLDRIAADLTSVGIAGAVVNGTTPDDWPQIPALSKPDWGGSVD